jgi:hypothetical protein
MLVLGIGSMPAGYYDLLRWIVCFAAVITSGAIYDGAQRSELAPLPFAVIAFVWNPFVPIYQSRDTWRAFDLIAAALFAWGATLKQDREGPARAGPRA